MNPTSTDQAIPDAASQPPTSGPAPAPPVSHQPQEIIIVESRNAIKTQSDSDYWAPYGPVLVGAFGSVLAALLAVYFTNKHNKKQVEYERAISLKKEAYFDFLDEFDELIKFFRELPRLSIADSPSFARFSIFGRRIQLVASQRVREEVDKIQHLVSEEIDKFQFSADTSADMLRRRQAMNQRMNRRTRESISTFGQEEVCEKITRELQELFKACSAEMLKDLGLPVTR